MKEKFLQFFTGKMSKSIYISIAAAVVCGAVVITSTVIVHNNNQKIDSVLESLSASESVSESVAESGTESVSDADNTDSGAQAKAPNGEPAGDKALQYLAEYDALTKEYERKRAELSEKANKVTKPNKTEIIDSKPKRYVLPDNPLETPEEHSKRQAAIDADYEQKLKAWERESLKESQAQASREYENELERAEIEEAKRKLAALDAQYEKDVAALKDKYGIS